MSDDTKKTIVVMGPLLPVPEAPAGEPDLCTVGDLQPGDLCEAAEDLHGTAGGMIPAGAIIEMRSRVGGACFAALVVSREGVALRVGLAGKVRRLRSAAAQQPAPAETLTIDGLLRTACQVALLPDDAPGNEDAGVAAAQVLLTPRARLELAVEQLEALGAGHICLGEGAEGVALLRSLGALVQEELTGSSLREHARHTIGRVCIFAQHTRPASLDDARRLLEGR